MNRHMRRIGHEAALGVKQGAGKIETLFDVDRIGGVGKRCTHLLGNRHKQVVEHFEHDRIGVRPNRLGAFQRRDACQDQVSIGVQLGAPAGLNDICAGRLFQDRRPVDGLARHHAVAIEKRR